MKSFTIFAASSRRSLPAPLSPKQGRRRRIPSPLKITVAGYSDGGDIPEKYTCAAKPPGGSPQIEWSGAPAGTMSLRLDLSRWRRASRKDVRRRDALDRLEHSGHRYRLAGRRAATKQILPDGTHQGKNIAQQVGYMGPCPPPGLPHHYTLEVYALDSKLDLPATAGRDDLEKALSGHILASGVYNGLFHR